MKTFLWLDVMGMEVLQVWGEVAKNKGGCRKVSNVRWRSAVRTVIGISEETPYVMEQSQYWSSQVLVRNQYCLSPLQALISTSPQMHTTGII